jgi:hypothetical protein
LWMYAARLEVVPFPVCAISGSSRSRTLTGAKAQNQCMVVAALKRRSST